MDTEAICEEFWREGIVILDGFFERERVKPAADALAALVARDKDKPCGENEYGRRFDTRVKVWPAKDVPECVELMADPRLAELAAAICGEGYKQSGFGIFSTPKGCGQGWHQDSRDLHPRHFELNRIIFPSDVTPEMGELFYVPRTYKGGHLPPGGNHEPLPGEKRAAPTAGSLVLMHTRTFHRVALNETGRERTQFNSRVMPAESPDDICAYPVFRQGFWCFKTGKPE